MTPTNKFVVIAVFFSCFCLHQTSAYLGIKTHHYDIFSGASVRGGNVSTLWFQQNLDHFTTTETRTWKQRYYVSEDYLDGDRKRGFLLLGGEGPLSEYCPISGSWLESVHEYGGLIVCLEHRFYGESQPFTDLSTENLKYLSSVQALADAATFIEKINQQYKLDDDVKWIVYGASYSGSLAAWLRYLYPHLVYGAVSHSGPLEAVLDFKEYLQVVQDDMAQHSTECVEQTKSAFSELDEITTSCLEDTELYQYLDTLFNLCETIQTSEGNDNDLANLFEVLTDDTFAYVAQYNTISGIINVNTICNIMVNESLGNPLDRLGQARNLLHKTTCLDYKYTTMLKELSNTTIDLYSMMRQWYYQSCTEFGFFQTSTQDNPIFGSRFDINFFVNVCQDLFGAEFNETFISSGIEATNTRYGGKTRKASNVIYIHGDMDPWHVLGKLEVNGESGSKAILIRGGSHCAAFATPSDQDPTELVNARKQIRDTVAEWITGKSPNSSVKVNALSVISIIFISVYVLLM